jgi:hypothetical protein
MSNEKEARLPEQLLVLSAWHRNSDTCLVEIEEAGSSQKVY